MAEIIGTVALNESNSIKRSTRAQEGESTDARDHSDTIPKKYLHKKVGSRVYMDPQMFSNALGFEYFFKYP